MSIRSFLLYVRHFECQCSNVWSSSELYCITVVGEQRRVEPYIGAPESFSPFGISVLPPRRVAVCFDCAAELEAQITRNLAEQQANWEDTLRRKGLEDQRKPGGVKKVKAQITRNLKVPYIPSASEL